MAYDSVSRRRRIGVAPCFRWIFVIVCLLANLGGWGGDSFRHLVAADADEAALEALEEISLWEHTVNLRSWAGYKDNVLLSRFNDVESAFLGAGLDWMVFRLPVDQYDFYAFLTADHRQYLKAEAPSNERLLFGQAQWAYRINESWKAGTTGQYTYQKQVFDVSTTEAFLRTVLAEGHSVEASPFVETDLGDRHSLKFMATGNRQFFKQPLDDYWEAGPGLEYTLHYRRKSRLVLSYYWKPRWYDTRSRRGSDGFSLAGDTLAFWQHEFEALLRHYWDERRRWRTDTKLSLDINRDNGGGYFNYFQYRLGQKLHYRLPPWEFAAAADLRYYDYTHQRVTAPSLFRTGPSRYRTDVSLRLRGEWAFTERWTVFAEYEYEKIFSNDPIDEYAVNVVYAGVDYEF